MLCMENAKKSNYLGTKFLVDNLKKDRKTIMAGGYFKGFGFDGLSKDITTKTYFDTQDFFLHLHGITINKNDYKGKLFSDLVVRYESDKKRIEFLSSFPDTFAIQIPAKNSIFQHIDFIAYAIGELLPSGMGVDVPSLIGTIAPVVVVNKKREYMRSFSANGLKMFVYFTQAEYSTPLIPKLKQRLEMVEFDSDTIDHKKEYDEFIKKVAFSNPNLIELQHSDVLIGREYLFNVK